MLQIRLKSLIVWSDWVRARTYISEPLSLYKVLEPWYRLPRSCAAEITPSMVAKENSLKSVLFEEVSPSCAEVCSWGRAAILSLTLPRRFRISSAPSSLREAESRLSQSPPAVGANLENLVSNSSGSSTLVIISTIESADAGIASIIRGMSSASNPHS